VDDVATSLLMEEFYAELWRNNPSPLDALQRAQLAILRHPERVERRRQELAPSSDPRGLGTRAVPLPAGDATRRLSPPAWWAGFQVSGDFRSNPKGPPQAGTR
jgi:CHAT domain-containing protein